MQVTISVSTVAACGRYIGVGSHILQVLQVKPLSYLQVCWRGSFTSHQNWASTDCVLHSKISWCWLKVARQTSVVLNCYRSLLLCVSAPLCLSLCLSVSVCVCVASWWFVFIQFHCMTLLNCS